MPPSMLNSRMAILALAVAVALSAHAVAEDSAQETLPSTMDEGGVVDLPDEGALSTVIELGGSIDRSASASTSISALEATVAQLLAKVNNMEQGISEGARDRAARDHERAAQDVKIAALQKAAETQDHQHTQERTALQQERTALQQERTTLQKKIADQNEEIAARDEKIAAHVDELKGCITMAQSSDQDAQRQVQKKLEANMATLATKVNDADAKASAADAKASAVSRKTDALEARRTLGTGTPLYVGKVSSAQTLFAQSPKTKLVEMPHASKQLGVALQEGTTNPAPSPPACNPLNDGHTEATQVWDTLGNKFCRSTWQSDWPARTQKSLSECKASCKASSSCKGIVVGTAGGVANNCVLCTSDLLNPASAWATAYKVTAQAHRRSSNTCSNYAQHSATTPWGPVSLSTLGSNGGWLPGYSHREACNAVAPNWAENKFAPKEAWLQIELPAVQTIHGIQTRGDGTGAYWVTQLQVDVSDDGVDFHPVGGGTKYWGNSDAGPNGNTKTIYFPVGTSGKFLRVYPLQWSKKPVMQVGLLCEPFIPRAPGCTNINPPDEDRTFIGSVKDGPDGSHGSWKGRLDSSDYWFPEKDANGGETGMLLDLKVKRSVFGVVIQGAVSSASQNGLNAVNIQVKMADELDQDEWTEVMGIDGQTTMPTGLIGDTKQLPEAAIEGHVYFKKDEIPSGRYLKVLLPDNAGWGDFLPRNRELLMLRLGLICDACMDTFRSMPIAPSFKDPPSCHAANAGPSSCTDIVHPRYAANNMDCLQTCDPRCAIKAQGCPFDLSTVTDDERCEGAEWATACTDPSWTYEEAGQPILTQMDALRLCQVKCNPDCDPSVVPMSAIKPAWIPSAMVPVGHLHCKDKFTLVTQMGNSKNRASPVPQRVSVCGACDEGYALKPAYVMGYKVVGVCLRLDKHPLYAAMASRCTECNEGCEAPCTDLQSLTCYEFLGDYGEYEDPEAPTTGTMMAFQQDADLARAAANGDRAMAFTCAQVAADDREDAVVSWTDADTDAIGSVYRLVQMTVAECHSSKVDDSSAMACASQKQMATCHSAPVNLGKHASQVDANLALKAFDKATVTDAQWTICTKLQQRKLTSV